MPEKGAKQTQAKLWRHNPTQSACGLSYKTGPH
jgi:hypothetical protein